MTWKGRVAKREVSISERFPVRIIKSLLANFLYSNMNEDGFLSWSPVKTEEEIENYFHCLGYPQVDALCMPGRGKLFTININYNHARQPVDITYKVIDVLRGVSS